MQEGGGGEGEEDEAQEEDGVERSVADVCLVKDSGSDTPEEPPVPPVMYWMRAMVSM